MSNPTTFLRVWEYVRSVDAFSILDLCNLGISKDHASWYLRKMLRQGYIVCQEKRKKRKEYNKYSLAPGVPTVVPVLNKKEKSQQRSPRQKTWTTMRIFVQFTLSDLQIATDNSYNACLMYVRQLVRQGYIKIVSKKGGGINGRECIYQLIQNTGPLALKIRRDGSVIDPNVKHKH